MSTFECIVVVLPKKDTREHVIQKVHELLQQAGALIPKDPFFMRHDVNEQEFEPLWHMDEKERFQMLINWPTLGIIDYTIFDEAISAHFYAKPNQQVDAILISIPSRQFYKKNAEGMQLFYQKLAKELHQNLEAKRTFLAWEPFSNGGTMDEEIERVKQGMFMGSYCFDEK